MHKIKFVFLLLLLHSCREPVFNTKIEIIEVPSDPIELSAEKVKSDEIYSFFVAVYDSLIISSRPNSTDYFFYAANLKTNKLLGSFMHSGQGPSEYLQLFMINRIERKGDDLIALTYETNRRELLELNITQSIALGRDSVKTLGFYQNPNDILTYGSIYQIDELKYVGYTTGFLSYTGLKSLPAYWILEGIEGIPTKKISIVDDFISNANSVIPEENFFDSAWSLSPDNTKIVSAMRWLGQINIINLNTGEIKSYRLSDSPKENIFYTTMEGAKYQYHDVTCNNDFIFALHNAQPHEEFKDNIGCNWIHVFDWSGKFLKKYHIPISVYKICFDPASETLYGYCDLDGNLYKLVPQSD